MAHKFVSKGLLVLRVLLLDKNNLLEQVCMVVISPEKKTILHLRLAADCKTSDPPTTTTFFHPGAICYWLSVPFLENRQRWTTITCQRGLMLLQFLQSLLRTNVRSPASISNIYE